MSKGMKKGLTIGGLIIVILLGLMLLIPLIFKGKIKDAIVTMANENLNAKVVIDEFGLNLFSNFPNATLSLNDVSITGIDEFESDTLLSSKSASVTINLMSLFGDNYDISKIDLERTSVLAKVTPEGKANWDIVKTDSTETAVAEDENSSAFNLKLENISIKDCNIAYEDLEGNMKAYIKGWNGNIKGDFSASETTLTTKSEINELTFVQDGVPFLSKVRAIADAKINANFDTMKFTFEDSNFNLNDLKASVDGSVAYIKEGEMDFDLRLNAPEVDFKQVLSLIPAMYTAEFKNVQTSGEVALSAYAVGKMIMDEDIYPALDLQLTVKDAMFKYPALPGSVDNINVILSVNGEGGSLDNLMILVDKFSFAMSGNPFSGSFRMVPAVNDKSIKFNAVGKLDLAMIKDVYPLDSVELKGKVDADIRIATTMSAIEKEQYENTSANGHINLSGMEYKSADLPPVQINTASLEFTPKYLNLSALDVAIGKSDIKASGRLENFIAYALKDQTLKGVLNIRSSYLNLDELMGDEEATTEAETDESSEDIIIPKNIDFTLDAALQHVVFSQIDLKSVSGAITVKDGILSLNNVAANTLGGAANISGGYNTSDPKNPIVDFNLGLAKISFAETFQHIEAVQKFAPIFEDVIGTYSMNLKFNTKLGATAAETLRALTGSGSLLTNDVKLEGNKALAALGSALKTDKLDNLSTKDLNLPFTIENGALATKPFNFSFGNGGEMTLEGVTRLDQTIDYKGSVKLPASLENKYVNKIPITIGGTFADPKIGVDVKGAVSDAVGSIVGGLLGKGEGSDDSTDLQAKISEEKAKQIEKIRDEADKAALKIVDAAKKVAKEAEDKAGSNPIAKAAAKKLGQEGVKKAETEAQKLRDKAEEQIKKLEGEQPANSEEAPEQ